MLKLTKLMALVIFSLHAKKESNSLGEKKLKMVKFEYDRCMESSMYLCMLLSYWLGCMSLSDFLFQAMQATPLTDIEQIELYVSSSIKQAFSRVSGLI